MAAIRIEVDDPGRDDVRGVLERHLTFAHQHTPAEDVHALEAADLQDPQITFYSARIDGQLVGIGALKQLDATHGELKSMHTAEAARRQGIGRAIVDHLVAEARRRGYNRLSLETGTMAAFAPARSLYRRTGFARCEPFDQYTSSPNSICMTLTLS